jgi:hypothetical protein
MFRLRPHGDAKDRRGRRCAASKLPCHLSEEFFLRGQVLLEPASLCSLKKRLPLRKKQAHQQSNMVALRALE